MKEMITVFTETRHGDKTPPLAERLDAYGVNTANGRASKLTRFVRHEKSHHFWCERTFTDTVHVIKSVQRLFLWNLVWIPTYNLHSCEVDALNKCSKILHPVALQF